MRPQCAIPHAHATPSARSLPPAFWGNRTMPPAITSFYHAIYKRLWAVGQASNAHKDDPTSFGGFSLRSPGEPNGIFGQITTGQFAGQFPLANSNIALANPLYVLLLRSLDA